MADMDGNPWKRLPQECPYILEIDRKSEYIQRYQQVVSHDTKLMVESIPEPFIGNPKTAKVVLLNLNPGHSKTDKEEHCRSEIKEAMLHNLYREPQEYPFYPLNPAFKGTGVEKYWTDLKIRKLQEEAGIDTPTFAKKLLVIEWFPYHSTRSALPKKCVCESQKYSFQLVKQMLEEGVEIVGMRSRDHWLSADQGFSKIPFLKNNRHPWISRGNMDEGLFDKLVAALKVKAPQ